MAAIYWLRNDLRTIDNKALLAFCQNAKKGLIVYTLDPDFKNWGIYRQKFLLQSLCDLNSQFKKNNQEIIGDYFES